MGPRLFALAVAAAVLVMPVIVGGEGTTSSRAARHTAAKNATASENSSPPAPPPAAPTSTLAAPASIAPLAESPSRPAPSFLSTGSTLLFGSLVLVGLLYAATRLMRRLPFGRFLPSADGPIRVTARTHLGARESLCLIDVGATTLLVAITAQSIQMLHVWPDGVKATARPVAAAPVSVPGQLRELAARLSGTR
jgi:flagellar biogenesis protein FliO